MRWLYLQIYVAFLGILLLFGVLVTVASLLIPMHSAGSLRSWMGWGLSSANSCPGQIDPLTSYKLQ